MRLSSSRKVSLAEKARRFADNLKQDERARSYLASRGISLEVAEIFSLGSVPDGEEYAGRISIPYTVPTGVVDIKYRALTAGKPKYLKETGTGEHLYNAQILVTSPRLVIITEGEFKAMFIQAYCGIPSVGFPGATTWKGNPHWTLCFEGIEEVVVVEDGDPAGREAAKKVADWIGWSARVMHMEDGMQADTFIAQHGAAAFIEEMDK